MRKILLIICILGAFSMMNAQEKLQHGLLLGGGKGNISSPIDPSYIDGNGGHINGFYTNYLGNASLGYRIRINRIKVPKDFLDIDMNVNAKAWKATEWYRFESSQIPEASGYGDFGMGGTSMMLCFSISSTYNYRIFKGLNAGIGIAPTYFLENQDDRGLDIPLMVKVGYDFKFLEIGMNYKYGLLNTLKEDFLKSGKFRDWQINLFIPF
ncbi:MAG: hypothetical protein LBE91_13315 [Tannerella sp.]|jgi:hypothetical protein|nr:hypothetical protein [Tannerella sp.]